MKIEIFGPGCAKCNTLEKLVTDVVKELSLNAEIVKVKEINEMVNRGVMFTPALFIDGVKKSEGKVPTLKQLKEMIGKAKEGKE